MQKNKPTAPRTAKKQKSPLLVILCGGGAGLALSVALCALLSVAVMCISDPLGPLGVLAALCMAAGGFCASYFAARQSQKNRFAMGLAAGAVLLLPAAVFSLLSAESGGADSIFSPIGLLTGVMGGAFLATHKRQSRKKQMKKLMKR